MHKTLILTIALLIAVGAPTNLAARAQLWNVTLGPRQPAPGDSIRLTITGAGLKEITIRYSTYTDRNGDGIYSGDEVRDHTRTVQNNGKGDLSSSWGRIAVKLYKIPRANAPHRYVAEALAGGTSKKAKPLNVAYPRGKIQPEKKGENPILALLRWPFKLAERLAKSREGLSKGFDEAGGDLYLFNVETKSAALLLKRPNKNVTYLEPSWGHAGRLLFVRRERRGPSGIALLKIDKNGRAVGRPQRLTGGRDASPYFLNDGRHVVFVRGKRLYLTDIDAMKPRVLSGPTDVRRLHGTLTAEGRAAIVYSDATGSSYMLLLDKNSKPHKTLNIVTDPSLALIQRGDGKEVVYATKGRLYVQSRKRRFPTDITPRALRRKVCSQPAWSPKGGIVFIAR